MYKTNEEGWLSRQDAKQFRDLVQTFAGEEVSLEDLDMMEQILRGDDVVFPDESAERIVDILHKKLRTVWNMLQIIYSASSLNMHATGEEVCHKPNLVEAINHFLANPSGAKRFREEHTI